VLPSREENDLRKFIRAPCNVVHIGAIRCTVTGLVPIKQFERAVDGPQGHCQSN
jgi:hypothetical protein